MVSFVVRRLLYSVPVILLATILVFVFVRETTDPTARLRSRGDEEAVARERSRLHLDDPLPVQYGNGSRTSRQGTGATARSRTAASPRRSCGRSGTRSNSSPGASSSRH